MVVGGGGGGGGGWWWVVVVGLGLGLGREFLERKLNYRPTWNLTVTQVWVRVCMCGSVCTRRLV